MQAALRVHDRLVRDAIEANGGHIFKTIGDAFCAAFATPESAAGAAIDAQRSLNAGTADERDGEGFLAGYRDQCDVIAPCV